MDTELDNTAYTAGPTTYHDVQAQACVVVPPVRRGLGIPSRTTRGSATQTGDIRHVVSPLFDSDSRLPAWASVLSARRGAPVEPRFVTRPGHRRADVSL